MLTIPSSLTMTSREIAELTGKEHKNVLVDIRKMLDDLQISSADFSAEWVDSTGRTLTMFNLPKRETIILTSGYSVTQRAAIIDRWLALEDKPAVHLSPMEMVIASAQAIMRIELAQATQKKDLEALTSRMDNLNGETGYRTVTAFLRTEGITKSLAASNLFGRECSKLCKSLGMAIGKVPDERFGTVNSYPLEVLREVLALE